MTNGRSGGWQAAWLLAAGALSAPLHAQETMPEAAPAVADAPVASAETIPVAPAFPAEAAAPAPTGNDTVALDEVVVTAQKTKQNVRNVPISMSVLSEKFIAQHGIVDIVQAMQFVPNVKISTGGFFAAPQARGFSFNNNNKAFESPLGIAFDGIPYTSTTYFNSGLFDVERVEVLRGPQGTTFGKNTTAGLVSIVTNDPTADYSGTVSLQDGQLGRKHAEVAFGGPIIDDVLEFRIAGVYDDLDGFVHNTTSETDPGLPSTLRGYSHKGYRAKLKFPNLFGTQLKLQYEDVTLDNTGSGIEMWHTTSAFRAFARKYDPNADFTLGNDRNSEDGPDFRNAKTKTFVGEWTIPVGDWEITALGGQSTLTEILGADVDFTPVPGLNGFSADRFPSTTGELRLKSPELDGLLGLNHLFGMDLGHTTLLTGVFYQARSIEDSYFRFTLNDLPFLELTAVSEVPDNVNLPDIASLPLEIGGVLINPLEVNGTQETFNQIYDQKGHVLAGFAQMEWNFLPQWTLQLGARFSHETKEGHWNLVFESPEPNLLLPLIGLQQFETTRTIEENQLQPKVSLNWKPTDQLSLFAHWTRGFKGGGFNAFAYRNDDAELSFKPETTTEWGVDMKGSFLGGTLRPNISLYRMDAREFQVLGREKPPVVAGTGGIPPTCTPVTGVCVPPQVIGLGTTRVFNAPKAYAQGVEADVNWLNGGFTLLATLGYNDTKFVEFPQNECPSDNSATYCDASGRPFAFAPRWDATFTPGYLFNLPWGLSLTPSVTAQYISSQILDTDVDEQKRQRGFMRYNASIGIGSLVQGWTFQIIGKNLGDQHTSIRYGDLTAAYFVSVPEPGREIFGQFRWNF